MAVIDIVLAFFVGVIILNFVLQCIRQIYSRWYCDTQEYYSISQDREGNEFIQWWNLSKSDLDNRLDLDK
jgi:hypothetical protein